MTRHDVERLLDLPANERLHLAEVLLDSVVEDEPQALTAEERELIETRLAAHRAAPDDALDWDEVKRRVRGR